MRPLEKYLNDHALLVSGGVSPAYNVLFVVILVLLPLATAPAATAMNAERAVSFIDGFGAEAFATLQQPNMTQDQREEAFDHILHKGFDLDLIARFVLGNYWRQATPKQRSDYLNVFGRFAVKTYARRLRGFTGRSFVVVGSSVTGGKGDIIVKTRIDRPSGPPIFAGWRVREMKGVPKIIDIVVEGVSMAVTQRQEFISVTRRSGIDGLVHVLRAKTETLTAAAG